MQTQLTIKSLKPVLENEYVLSSSLFNEPDHNLDSKPVCWACLQLCNDAYQTPHPCRICKNCRDKTLEELKTANGIRKIKCPAQSCINTTVKSEDLQCPDFISRKQFEKIEFYCPNHHLGCNSKLRFMELLTHIQKCSFEKTNCKFCCSIFTKNNLEEHENNECLKRLINCEHCSEFVSAEDMLSNHFQIENPSCCKKKVYLCIFCNEMSVTKEQMFSEHFIDCSAKPRKCSFQSVGCKFVGQEDKTTSHESDNYLDHQLMMLRVIENQQDQLKYYNQQINELKRIATKLTKVCVTSILPTAHKEFMYPLYDIKLCKAESLEFWTSEMFFLPEPYIPFFFQVNFNFCLQPRKERYISLYLVFPGGPYDEIINWPIQVTIKFGFVDLNEADSVNNFLCFNEICKPGSCSGNKYFIGSDSFMQKRRLLSPNYIQNDTVYAKTVFNFSRNHDNINSI